MHTNHKGGGEIAQRVIINQRTNFKIQVTLSNKDSVALSAPSGLPKGKEYLRKKKTTYEQRGHKGREKMWCNPAMVIELAYRI